VVALVAVLLIVSDGAEVVAYFLFNAQLPRESREIFPQIRTKWAPFADLVNETSQNA
jgi:hypothetical protein